MAQTRLIYLVDDAADYRFLVQQVFTMFLPEHKIQFFADGAELIDSLDQLSASDMQRPDVISLDVDMPRLNGFQTLVQLKSFTSWQQVPVVMMTNRDQEEYRTESLRLGASTILLKPISLTDIKDVMTRIMTGTGDFSKL